MSIFSPAYWLQLSPKDWLLRFISLGLATVLWYYVGGEDIVNKNVMVPVEIINLPSDLVISNQFKKEIEVSVSGPRSLVLDMGNRDIRRQVDLEKATPGTMVIKNSNDAISVPRGIKVQRIKPDTIILSLDKLVQKRMVVTPVTNGVIASDYILKGIRMEPDSISITGPETVLKHFEVLRTKVIKLDGLKASSQIQVPLDLDSVIVELIGETTVTAHLDIAVETVQKKIANVPVEVKKDGELQRVTPATVSLIVAVPKTILRENVALHSLFTVTAEAIGKDNRMLVKVNPTRKFTDPIHILQIDPKEVTLIEEAPVPVVEGEQGQVVVPEKETGVEQKKAAQPEKEKAADSNTP